MDTLSKGRWSFHSEKSWHQFLLNNCMLQAGSGKAPGNCVAGIAKQRPAIKGKQITPGGVSLFGSGNLEGGPSTPVRLDYLEENLFTKMEESKPGTVAHTCQPGTWEVELGG